MKVAIYARVSSEDQQERGTIENQLEFATKYCDLHQLEIAAWYKDDGVTGTLPLQEREAGKKLIEDAKNKLFDTVLIFKLDRFGRSARIILNGVYELESYGVKIKSMTEPFDTGDPNGRFLLTILAGVADLERETILSRMWYGANRAARAGKWLGGIVPYGYYVDEGFLAISEEPLPGMDLSEADVILMIFDLIANQGYSTIKAADYLNALGIPPSYTKDERKVKQGKRKVNTAGIWRPARIRNMLVSKTYMGIHEYGKRTKKDREIITREVPAIVSEEIWMKAQEALRNNQLEATRNAKRQYLLRGLIKCGTCGITYQGTAYSGPKGKPKAYYVCGGKIQYIGPQEAKCQSKNIPALQVEKMVWDDIVSFVDNPGEAIKELSANMESKKVERRNLEDEKPKIRQAIMEKENEKQSILDLYRKKLITSADIEKQLMKITNEVMSLEQRIRDLDNEILEKSGLEQRFDTAEALLEDLREKVHKKDLTFEEKRSIAKTLVKEVKVNTQFTDSGKPMAFVTTNYCFSNGVIRTDMGSYW